MQPCKTGLGDLEVIFDPIDGILIDGAFLLCFELDVDAEVEQSVGAFLYPAAFLCCVLCVLFSEL